MPFIKSLLNKEKLLESIASIRGAGSEIADKDYLQISIMKVL